MNEILSIFAVILGIVGLAGGAAGYFGKARGDAIIKYQAEEIELRDGTIARLEKDNARTTAERDRLLQENETLRGLAQGSPKLDKLVKEVAKLKEQMKRHGKS